MFKDFYRKNDFRTFKFMLLLKSFSLTVAFLIKCILNNSGKPDVNLISSFSSIISKLSSIIAINKLNKIQFPITIQLIRYIIAKPLSLF